MSINLLIIRGVFSARNRRKRKIKKMTNVRTKALYSHFTVLLTHLYVFYIINFQITINCVALSSTDNHPTQTEPCITRKRNSIITPMFQWGSACALSFTLFSSSFLDLTLKINITCSFPPFAPFFFCLNCARVCVSVCVFVYVPINQGREKKKSKRTQ